MKFQLTSTSWGGEIRLAYDELGLLTNCDISGATLSEKQHVWFLKNLPRELAELRKLIDGVPTAKLTEVSEVVGFDDFWNRYGEKTRSSKKKAITRWNRMSDSDRVKAYNFIPKYEKTIEAWQTKMYCETYLNKELWNN